MTNSTALRSDADCRRLITVLSVGPVVAHTFETAIDNLADEIHMTSRTTDDYQAMAAEASLRSAFAEVSSLDRGLVVEADLTDRDHVVFFQVDRQKLHDARRDVRLFASLGLRSRCRSSGCRTDRHKSAPSRPATGNSPRMCRHACAAGPTRKRRFDGRVAEMRDQPYRLLRADATRSGS
jgi:hypothetical protein